MTFVVINSMLHTVLEHKYASQELVLSSQTATPHVMSSQHGIYRTVSALVSLRFPSRFCEKLQRENTLEHVLEHCEART